jgi:putative colanic acid biosynthesis UDP-glucose lipid carrier transferase
LFGVGAHVTLRIAIRATLRELRRRGYNRRHIVIVSAGRLGRDIALRLARAQWSGLSVRAFYDDKPELAGTRVEGIPVRGPIDNLARDLAVEPVDQIWIALPLRSESRIQELLTQLRQHSVEVRLVPDLFNFVLLNHSVTEVAGLPVINLTESPLSGVNRVIKGTEDICVVNAPPAGRVTRDPADRAGGEALVAWPRVLSPGASDLEWRTLSDAQVPHDAGRCRGGDRAGVGARR